MKLVTKENTCQYSEKVFTFQELIKILKYYEIVF